MAVVERSQAAIQQLQRSGLGRFLAKYHRDRSDDYAALIAYTALFSVFPLIGGLLALLGLVLSDPATLEAAREAIFRLVPLSGSLVFLQETREISGLVGLISLGGLLWAGSALFGRMSRAFNAFYGLPGRGFIRQRVVDFVMIFVFLALILVSVIASSATTFLLALSTEHSPIPLPDLSPLQTYLGWAISFASAILLFLALYRVVPNGPVTFGGIWRGALLAAALFFAATQLFPLYLMLFGGGFAAFQVLGIALLLMTWFYFVARIVVLGCQLNAFMNPLPSAAPEPSAEAGPVAPAPHQQQAARADAPSLRVAAADAPGLKAPEPGTPSLKTAGVGASGLKERALDLALLIGVIVVLTVVRRVRADA
jgi:membrane protein